MYKEINDYELLYLIAENNEVAYNNMYSKYEKLVRIESSKYYKKIPYLGISYEDIYQAGLCGLDLAIKLFDETSGNIFYTCAATFIKREILTFIRSNNRLKHNTLSQSISLNSEIAEDLCLQDLLGSNTNEIDDYIKNQHYIDIINLKYDLPLFQALVYELKLNHFSNKEIAILLDTDYKTVDNSITGIKNKLKNVKNRIKAYL